MDSQFLCGCFKCQSLDLVLDQSVLFFKYIGCQFSTPMPYVIKGVVTVVLLSIILYCLSEVVESIRGYKEAGDIYDELSGMMDDILSPPKSAVPKGNKDSHGGMTESFGTPTIPEFDDNSSESDISGTIILLRAKFEKLRETNPDVIGWISIPGTVIDYPIVQTTDNDYYLDQSITGTYLKSGAIFVDFRNSSNWTDRNTVIYGHNMASGEMFAQLAKYRSGTFLRNNKYIYISDWAFEHCPTLRMIHHIPAQVTIRVQEEMGRCARPVGYDAMELSELGDDDDIDYDPSDLPF